MINLESLRKNVEESIKSIQNRPTISAEMEGLFNVLIATSALIEEDEYLRQITDNAWKTDKTNLPPDGSICNIILFENERGIGLSCVIVEDGKLTWHGVDVTEKVLKWHRIPGIIVNSEGFITWEESVNG